MNKQALSVHEMSTLRCRSCKNFLSCGPMTVVPDGTTLCGRCNPIGLTTTPSGGRRPAHTFNQVLDTVRLPCRYWMRHCKELLYARQMAEHEAMCIYKNRCELLCGDPSAAFKMEKKLKKSDEQLQPINVPRNARPWLLCVKCNLYLSGGCIYLNRAGHPFCDRCVLQPLSPGAKAELVRHRDLERLLSYMVFPCSFHMHGCARRFLYGDDVGRKHESQCPYGYAAQRGSVQRNISRSRSVATESQPRTPVTPNAPVAIPVAAPPAVPSNGGKQKGVIQTHTGHVFATLTPNTIQLFANDKNWKDGKQNLLDNLNEKVNKHQPSNLYGSGNSDNSDNSDQILDVTKLEQVPTRSTELRDSFRELARTPSSSNSDHSKLRRSVEQRNGFDELDQRNSFREVVEQRDSFREPKIPPPPPPPIQMAPIHRSSSSYTSRNSSPSPRLQSTYQNQENVPISPVFIQPQPSTKFFNNNNQLRHAESFSGNGSRPPGGYQGDHHMSKQHPASKIHQHQLHQNRSSMPSQMDEGHFQYGLPYGNSNLTFGVQPNVYTKDVSLERNSSMMHYNDLVSELKFKQRVVESENPDDY